MMELIHFAHGNGFPALCYKQMLERLKPEYQYCYVDRLGHDPGFPVSENWHNLVAEVIASIERQSSQPVIGLGHSLGGVLTLLAAIERPDIFKAVVLLDSPLIGRFKSNMVMLAKSLGVIDRVTPAYRTRGRRNYWENYDQLIAYLKTRPLFKTFTQSCLEDYIKYGLELKKDGFYLRFDRHIEYKIYRTIPHILMKYEGKLKVPAGLIYGDKSAVVDRMDIRYMQKHFGIKLFHINGTHMFPMEYPRVVAKQIKQTIDAIIK